MKRSTVPPSRHREISRLAFKQHILHFIEQFGRLKRLWKDLEPLKELPVCELIIVENAAHYEHGNSGAHTAQVFRGFMARHVSE